MKKKKNQLNLLKSIYSSMPDNEVFVQYERTSHISHFKEKKPQKNKAYHHLARNIQTHKCSCIDNTVRKDIAFWLWYQANIVI